MVCDGGARQKVRFGLAEDKFSLWIQRGNTSGVIGMEVREKYLLRANIQMGKLRREIFASWLVVGHAIDPIVEFHRLGVVAVRRMARKGVIESCVDEEVSEARMVYPMNENSEIAGRMIALSLLRACRIQVETSIHVDNAGPEGNHRNIARMAQHLVPVCERGGRNVIGGDRELLKSAAQQVCD